MASFLQRAVKKELPGCQVMAEKKTSRYKELAGIWKTKKLRRRQDESQRR